MPGDRDELAETATAAPSSPSSEAAPVPASATLGRYRLERELGAGGMGVVHAAFDPDLERRVALKVLRGGGSEDARKRLLREARAMARLSHPNVITVHEVSSVGGRDYVAMELVDGETLADWLRSGRRPEQQIIDAFVAAGRGLAAAHAAGMVHRDFKPHNVLRARTGRIVVTDFGLARETEGPRVDALETTLPTDAHASTTSSSSTPLGGLTVTGSLLGTPAYMAPEQWNGGAVTPATDQFAFSVALWEALTGARPYRGTTLEALREEVTRGPAELDVSKIPRRLRATLLRGLDPDPAKRFPSMEALLRSLRRADRRPLVFVGLGCLGMMTIAIVFAFAIRNKPVDAPPCPMPPLDPATIALPGAPRTLEASVLRADLGRWTAARARACTAEPSEGTMQRACLDVVLARLAAVAAAVRGLPPGSSVDAGSLLIDPDVCTTSRVPRLVTPSPAFGEAVAAVLRGEPASALTKIGEDACATTIVQLGVVAQARTDDERARALEAATAAADRCGDDRLRADVLIADAKHAIGRSAEPQALTQKLERAMPAVARVSQSDLGAELDLVRQAIALLTNNLDEALARTDAASRGFLARERWVAGLDAAAKAIDVRWLRGRREDLDATPSALAAVRQRLVERVGEAHDAVRELDRKLARYQWSRGDLQGAHATFAAAHRDAPAPATRAIAGQVLDPTGKPVTGAQVVVDTSTTFFGDAHSVSFLPSRFRRTATTDATGRYAIADAPTNSTVIAQLGALRSMPAPAGEGAVLRLEHTSQVRGRIALGKTSYTAALVGMRDMRLPASSSYAVFAPVAPDGTFELGGVPRTKVTVFVQELKGVTMTALTSRELTVKTPIVEGLELSFVGAQRRVHVLVRSTVALDVPNATVIALPGTEPASQPLRQVALRFDYTTQTLAKQARGPGVPPAVAAKARRGDLYATVDAAAGVASACGITMPAELGGDLDAKLRAHDDKIEVRCVPIPAGAEVVIVEVPPLPRMD